MTKPTTYVIRMGVFLVLVAAVVGFLSKVLWGIYWHNPGLNGLILLVLAVGIAWNLRQVMRLAPEVDWLEHYQSGSDQVSRPPETRLLAPMARMLRPDDRLSERQLTLSSGSTRSLLDSLASRLDESRELSRYMTGLLIFLGLLGTFWGLLKTIGAVADVINAMSIGTGDVTAMFEHLKAGLGQPLQGMGTAFSASLFGLAGALILGFLDLTAGQAQNRFFNELEEWLAGLTRLSSGALADGEGSVPVYVQALLEQTAENMESLRRVLLRGEEARTQAQQAMIALNGQIGALTDAVRTSQQLMQRMAETQASGDDVAVIHLRNIDLCLQRMAAEAEQGRAETTSDLRNDLRLLTRTVAALSEDKR
jgi:hypothetical protein